MCGIFGVMWHDTESIPDALRLKQTAKLLEHRGPDASEIYSNPGIGLVHTRLSLVDLNPRSNQPFWDKQGRYSVVFNGEIYNFRELRSELEQQGIMFKTTSDTEVLLEWIIKHGVESTLSRLEGMFAFGFYDRTDETLTLARDRFGIKPLFVYDQDDAFIFASEIGAMGRWITLKADPHLISAYLYGAKFGTDDHTLFKDIRSVTPGGVIKVKRGEGANSTYQRFLSIPSFLDPNQEEELKTLRPSHLIDQVEERLEESVRLQLLADAPVGSFCSGGVDSSLVLAIAAKTQRNLVAFHANIVGPDSEIEAASRLTKHLKIDLKIIEVRDQDFINEIPEVIEHFGHPFDSCPQSVPFLMVSRLARECNFKALLSGEGADECFLGYEGSVTDVRQFGHHTFSMAKNLGKVLLRRGRDPNTDQRRSIRNLVVGLQDRFEHRLELERIQRHINGSGGHTRNKNILKSVELLSFRLRPLLHRNDSMGMAASIETRFPYLDNNLVKLAVNMPHKYKVRFSPMAFEKSHLMFRDKWILRKVAERYLPADLSWRKKKPFLVPASDRLEIGSRFFAGSFIAEFFGLSSVQANYFFQHANKKLKIKCMQLEVWSHLFLGGLPKESMIKRLRDHVTI